MDRNFFLPIAVAAGVHSMLFISGTPLEKPPRAPDVVQTIIQEYTLPPLDPEPPETAEIGVKKPAELPPPSTPDIPTTNFDPDKITREVELRDMLPRPSAPDSNYISSDWQSAVTNATSKKGSLFSLISLDNTPAARFQPAPTYPQDLKATGFDGSVTVMFAVDVKGEVFDATVTNASHSRFAEEALRAVRRWRFEPGIKDGKRVAFRMVQTFSFTLSE